MANQIFIDIGAVANDGTGDPLRTAFDIVNDNFSNVWNTGLPTSNITFSGNRILTTNANGNLILAPNGIAKVVANVDIVPNMNIAHSLGAPERRWNTVYTQYLDVTGEVTFPGDVTINGNLTVEGDTIQIGNIVTDTKTIQLANTAVTANAANGSGVTVGANDDIATMLYNSTGNTWNFNIGVSAVGNVTAPYFIGNGSQLTGITSYANANAVAYGEAGWAGNIVPAGNNAQSLGNATNQWADLWVSNATIYFNSVPLTLTAGNVLTIGGEPILSNDSDTNITTTGNIVATNITATEWVYGNLGVGTQQIQFTDAFNPLGNSVNILLSDGDLVYESTLGSSGGFRPSADNSESLGKDGFRWDTIYGNVINATAFIGDGSQLTNLPFDATKIQNGTSNVEIATANGNVSVTANGTAAWNFDTTGNLTTPGNLVVGPGPGGSGSSILQYDAPFQIVGEGANAFVVSGWAANTNAPDSIAVVAFNAPYGNGTSNVQIAVGNNATTVNYWNFGNDGNLTLPQGGIINEGPSPSFLGAAVTITPANGTDADQQLKIYPTFAEGNHLHLTTGNLYNTELYLGDDNLYVKLANTGDVVINSNDGLGNSAQWTFGANSNLTAPGNIDTTGDVSANNVVATEFYGSGFNISDVDADLLRSSAPDINAVSNTIVLRDLGGNVTANSFIGDGSQLTGLPASYTNANVVSLLSNFGSNTISTTGNISGAFVAPATTANTYVLYNDSGLIGGSGVFTFDENGNVLTIGTTGGQLRVADISTPQAGVNLRFIPSSGTTLSYGNLNPQFANTYDLGQSGSRWNNMFANVANVSSLAVTGTASATSITLSGTGTAVNASSGNILTNKVTGTQFAFLNGIYTATLTGAGATSNYTLNLPANVGTNGQSLTSDGTGNLVWTTPASSYGNANVANFLASYGSNTISTTGNITAGNITGNINITGNVTGTSANVDLVAGAYTWSFNNTGNLVLPGNTFAVNYANGTAVSLGGGSYGNANVADFLDSLGSNAIVTAGNITGGNLISSATIFGNPDIILGNIANASATKTRIVTDTTFSYIQTGNGTVGSTGNIVFSPYSSSTQRVVIDTASGNITANGFVRGLELTSTNSVGNEGGQINLAVPAANTTLQNIVTVDVYQNQFRIFEGSANAKGAYIDLANCANGVGTNLINRASIIAAANTAVTLDNIQARVGGSPTRLYINTVSGNLTGAGQSQTLLSGSTAVSSWINVPIGPGAANAFAMSGALTSNGDTAILSLIDQGSGTGMWRITGMIANTTANLYGVTIERLV